MDRGDGETRCFPDEPGPALHYPEIFHPSLRQIAPPIRLI